MNDQIKHYTDKLEFETDSWDLQSALDKGEKIIVVDARSKQSYQKEHIPGAISLPHRTMTKESTHHLDRSAFTVTASVATPPPKARLICRGLVFA
jgi:rhodanese-related sulfurtransferase